MIADLPSRVVQRALRGARWQISRADGGHARWVCPDGEHAVTIPEADEVMAPALARRVYGAVECEGSSGIATTRAVTARVSREGRWWMIMLSEIDGLTQARRLADVEDRAGSYLGVDLDVAPDQMTVTISLDDIGAVIGLDDRMRELRRLREQGRVGREQVDRLAIELARDLANEGVPLPDIETVLGLRRRRADRPAAPAVMVAK